MQRSYEMARPGFLRSAFEWWPVAIILLGATMSAGLVLGVGKSCRMALVDCKKVRCETGHICDWAEVMATCVG